MAGVVMLAGVSHGGLMLCDEQGGSVGWVAQVASSNNTSRAEWILPHPGQGLNPLRKQYLKMTLEAGMDDGFVGFFFGKGPTPQFSVFVSGERTLLVPGGAYPAAEWF